jgi:prepilin signal peptidase PulO-like enzyme (type II secretory pathway)
VQPILSWPGWYLATLVFYGFLLAALAAHDVRRRRVPNRTTYPAIVGAIGLAFVQPIGPAWSFLAAGAVVLLGFTGLHLVSGGGIGMGDVKLATLVALLLGWPATIGALFVAFAVGAAVGVVLVGTGRLDRRYPIPFAPALALGALVGLVAGPQLSRLWWPFPA